MATVTDYFQQAQLSMAAYALGLKPGMSTSDYRAALEDKGMSQKQAEEFANTYSIVYQSPENDPSGFSATVFVDSSGKKYLAIRGSEGNATDWLGTNLGEIGTYGIAISQGIALFNFLQRLSTPVGQMAQQVEYVPASVDPITAEVTLPSVRAIDSVASLGYLSGVSGITVAGHSLGGHLAMMMSRFAPNLTSAVYTYNAPGFGVVNGDNGFFDLLRAAPIDPITGQVSTAWNPGIMAHLDVEGDIVHALPGYYTPGVQQIIFSESANQGIYDAHLKEPITDALSIYSLFATVDLTLNSVQGMEKITTILKASASTVSKILESTLDTLRTFFQENYALGTPDTNAVPTTLDDRDSFYTNLLSLQGYLKNLPTYNSDTQSLGFTVESLVGKDTSSLLNLAQSDIATRYALYKLNPFAIRNADDLYSAINNSSGALNVYNSATNTGSLTEQYFKDRASFLTSKLWAGTHDRRTESQDAALFVRSGAPAYFEDRGGASTYKLYQGLGPAVSGIPVTTMTQYLFGGSGVDTLTGGNEADHLYGMDGNDTLQGGKGNDYLEGGQGTDTYIYTSNDGLDTLLDTDGLGQITFDGTVLNGGNLLIGDTYQSADRNYFYTLLRNTGEPDSLLINAKGGTIVIEDFEKDSLLREAA